MLTDHIWDPDVLQRDLLLLSTLYTKKEKHLSERGQKETRVEFKVSAL